MTPLAPYRRIGWLFTLAWGAFVLFRRLLREGMWADGLTYAAIARNMAIGKGSFWSPVFASSFWLPYNHTETFYEHPPLLFYLQSWFFRLLGDSYATERVYCFVVFALIIVLMVQLWRQAVPATHPLHRWEWLPVLLLFTCPLTEWTYEQNYLDVTMSLFCLLTVKYTIAGWQNPNRPLLPAVLAVLALLAAFLTKGPVSLHVLAVPGLYTLAYDRPLKVGKAVGWTLVLAGGFGGLLALLLLYDPARIFLQAYFNQQVMAALSGKREVFADTAGPLGRTYIVQVLLKNIAPSLGLIGLVWLLNRFWRNGSVSVQSLSKASWFYVGLGLATTLPMMVTTKQIDYYVVIALPYMALGLAAWLGPSLAKLLLSWSLAKPALKTMTALGGLACLATVFYGIRIAGTPYHSYRTILSDVYRIGTVVPPDTKLGVCPDMMASVLLHSYIQRYNRLEMTTLAQKPAYFLTDSVCRVAQEEELRRAGYRPVSVPLERYVLYRRSEGSLLTKSL
ncbi:ArnT family glycosyltransferase [Larkinella sp. VNQ87]|uniref:ArnT family glycosyltransferase n=1 Tax=Larkinella sp. VNQ87 TaxID=3400921 RepID=UPI003BFFE715